MKTTILAFFITLCLTAFGQKVEKAPVVAQKIIWASPDGSAHVTLVLYKVTRQIYRTDAHITGPAGEPRPGFKHISMFEDAITPDAVLPLIQEWMDKTKMEILSVGGQRGEYIITVKDSR